MAKIVLCPYCKGNGICDYCDDSGLMSLFEIAIQEDMDNANLIEDDDDDYEDFSRTDY